MNKYWLEIVPTAGLALLVCLMGGFIVGVIDEAATVPEEESVSMCAGPGYIDDSLEQHTLERNLAMLPHLKPEDVAAGDALFKGNCAQCHAINEVIVGPALAGLTQRRPLPWIQAWVKNSGKLVASGDEYAVKLFAQYQKQEMPRFNLTDEEIRQIVVYTEAHSAATPVAAYAAD